MATICPTITAENPHVYREQIERVQAFTTRLHIDLMDGVFTPNTSVPVETVWWPEGITADIHLMFQNPEDQLDILVKLKPHLVTIHAESNCNILQFAEKLRQASIKCGVAVFPETSIESLGEYIQQIQHLLIFSGNLGYQGGSSANLDLLKKATQTKALNPELEIAWDGGVNAENVQQIAAVGIDVINAGGFIQNSDNPEGSYRQLQQQVVSSP